MNTKAILTTALIALGVPACAAPVGDDGDAAHAASADVERVDRQATIEHLRVASHAVLTELKANPELQWQFAADAEGFLASRGIDTAYIDDVARAFADLTPNGGCTVTCTKSCSKTCGKTCGVTGTQEIFGSNADGGGSNG